MGSLRFIIPSNLLRKIIFWSQMNNFFPISPEKNKVITMIENEGRREGRVGRRRERMKQKKAEVNREEKKKVSGFKKQRKKGKLVTSKNDKGLNAPQKIKYLHIFSYCPLLETNKAHYDFLKNKK